MIRFLLGAALALAAPATAQSDDGAAFLQRYAEAVRSHLPMTVNDGLVATEVQIRDRTLVVLVEDRNDIAAGLPPGRAAQEMGSGLARGFCEGDGSFPAEFFGRGLKLRADLLLKSGARIEGPAVERCPD